MGATRSKFQNSKQRDAITTINDIHTFKDMDNEHMIRLCPDPIPKDCDIVGKRHHKKIVQQYIELLSNLYDLVFPVELIQICFSFYSDQQTFHWRVDIERRDDKKQSLKPAEYSEQFEVSLFNTDIRGIIPCAFTVQERTAILNIKIGGPTSDIPSHKKLLGAATKLYHSITCHELDYECKGVRTWFGCHSASGIQQSFDCKEIANKFKTSLRFILSFRILPSLYMRQKISSLNVYPSSRNSFVWIWSEQMMNNVRDFVEMRYFSAHFYNEGCYCLWVKNVTGVDEDEKKEEGKDEMLLMFQLCVLRNPYQYNTKLFGGYIKICETNGTVCQYELAKKDLAVVMQLNPKIIIQSVEFTFNFYDSLI
eukprot:1159378_1